MLETSVAYVLMSYNQGIRPIHIKTKTSPRPKSHTNQSVNQHTNQHNKPKSPNAVELFFMRK
jgi:hypothetical protein